MVLRSVAAGMNLSWLTKAVVAIFVELSAIGGVGAFNGPVSVPPVIGSTFAQAALLRP